LGGKVLLVAVAAILLKFAVLAGFNALSPIDVFAEVLWSVTLVQVLARVIDVGLPGLLRIVLLRPIGQRAAAAPSLWGLYFGYCALTSSALIVPILLFSPDKAAQVPVLLLAFHCACVAVNNMVLLHYLAHERSQAIAWNQIAPHAVPLAIVLWEAVWPRGLFSDPLRLYSLYTSGDILLTVISLAIIWQRRSGRRLSMRRLFGTLRSSGTPRFLALGWCSQLVKLLNQKAERLLAFGLLSSEAYIVTNYVLAMRDGASGVAGIAMYKRFNAMLRQNNRTPERRFVGRLVMPTALLLVVTVAGALLCYAVLRWLLPFFEAYRFAYDAESLALMLTGILPFVYIQVVGQISITERSQSFNLFCQMALLGSMLLAQASAAIADWVPLAWLGPMLGIFVVLIALLLPGNARMQSEDRGMLVAAEGTTGSGHSRNRPLGGNERTRGDHAVRRRVGGRSAVRLEHRAK
jgi:hypothetical protein